MTASGKASSLKDFVIEVLGIDGKGFRLMWDVLVRPRTVFEAFLGEHQTRYAPPIRVWLWVFGVKAIALLSIGGAGGMFSRINDAQHGENFAGLLARLDVDMAQFLALANNWWNFFHPVLVLVLSIPAAITLELLKRAAPFAGHANVYLSAFLATSLVSIVTAPAVFILAPSSASVLGVLNAVIFAVTFLRGGGAGMYFSTKTGALFKTAFVTMAFFVTSLIASMILLFALVFYAKAGSAG